jgi:hypothetical protein
MDHRVKPVMTICDSGFVGPYMERRRSQARHFSRFFAGGNSREYTGLARNCFGS